MYRSRASKPLSFHRAGSPCLARRAARALTGKISGVVPSKLGAFSLTKASTWSRSALFCRMSILLIRMTTFLPQSRILSRKTRSLSVKGRSAEVTNSTRSERGTNWEVITSCWRMIALVPGVSTMLMSVRNSTGKVQTDWFSSMIVPVWLSRNARFDLGRGGRDPLLQQALPQEGVDQGAFAGVELTDDHQQEEFIQLLDGLTQRLPVFVRGAELHQGDPQIVQELALRFEQFFLLLVEYVHVFHS